MPIMGGVAAARAIAAEAAERGLWAPPMVALSANVSQEARIGSRSLLSSVAVGQGGKIGPSSLRLYRVSLRAWYYS